MKTTLNNLSRAYRHDPAFKVLSSVSRSYGQALDRGACALRNRSLIVEKINRADDFQRAALAQLAGAL